MKEAVAAIKVTSRFAPDDVLIKREKEQIERWTRLDR